MVAIPLIFTFEGGIYKHKFEYQFFNHIKAFLGEEEWLAVDSDEKFYEQLKILVYDRLFETELSPAIFPLGSIRIAQLRANSDGCDFYKDCYEKEKVISEKCL